MGDFVSKGDVDRIRAHYRVYMAEGALEKGDNRGTPLSGVFDSTTFREVSTHYVNRLLRFIETEEMIADLIDSPASAGTQPLPPEWRSTNPLHDLVDRKRADIVILRPSALGRGMMDAGVGHAEMHHGWGISVHFLGEPIRYIDEWDPAWLWCLAP